ncbi:hypothetical protein BH11PLA2_BH11PLA2_01850 [soil metagenome]
MEATDLDLCQRYARGDNAAGAAILERHAGLIGGLLLKMNLPRHAPRADLRQAGRLAMLRAAAAFDARGVKFATYATPAIRNTLVRDYEHYRRWSRRNGHAEGLEERTASCDAVARSAVDLSALTPMQRTIIRRRYGFDGEPATTYAIAESLGTTPYYVTVLHDQALATIRGIREAET